jgi:hypothetical protein
METENEFHTIKLRKRSFLVDLLRHKKLGMYSEYYLITKGRVMFASWWKGK